MEADPCGNCGVTEDEVLIYDYLANKVKTPKRPALVHSPFSFITKNVNPFKDSVLIGHQTVNFNTEVPSLFNKLAMDNPIMGLNNLEHNRDYPNRNSSSIEPNTINKLEAWRAKLKQLQRHFKEINECYDICRIQKEIIELVKKDFQFSNGFLDYLEDLNVNNLPHYELIEEVMQLYRYTILTQTSVVYQIPQIENVDQYIFDITVLPKRGVQKSKVLTHQPIRMKTRGGIKFDFSTGFFFDLVKV